MTNDIERFTGLNEAELAFAIPAIDFPIGKLQKGPVEEFAVDPAKQWEERRELRRLGFAFVQEPARRVISSTSFVRKGRLVFDDKVTVEGRMKRRPHSHDRRWHEKYRPWYRSVQSRVAVPFEMKDLSGMEDASQTKEITSDSIAQLVASFREALQLDKAFAVTPQCVRADKPAINVSSPQNRRFPRRFR